MSLWVDQLLKDKKKKKQGFWLWQRPEKLKNECSSTQQIGQDLSHSSQNLLCVQWAYLLTVLLNFEPFGFFPSLILYLQTLHVKNECSVLNLGGAEKAVNLTGARLSKCTGILMPDNSWRLAKARLKWSVYPVKASGGIMDRRTTPTIEETQLMPF